MALGEYCSILQVVGFQNSGKTTLMEKLISRSIQDGFRVASIKHHGHGGVPVHEAHAKDSMRHYEAGAVVSSVEGDGVLQLHGRMEQWSLSTIIKLYEFFSLDVIFVEGYKKEGYPKVVLIRDEQDLAMLDTLTNIACVISHVKLGNKLARNYRVFQLSEDARYINFLMEEVVKKSGTGFI
jgi:molybdopterin-guanine dinucleotide biosynthesis adapter protein